MAHHKLSFWTAVLVNINVMFGAGIFINTVILAHYAGFLGFISYLLVALMLIPLIMCIGTLLSIFPDGGFYTYAAKTMSPLAGFISAWAYFTGKLASAALLIHVFSSFITSLIPTLAIIPLFALDISIIGIFTFLNLYHMKLGRTIMYTFMVFKVFPILFAIICSLYLYKLWFIAPETLLWSGIPTTIPLVLFAFTGFEACCSLSSSLENAQKNGPRVIFLTYGFVACITILYQFLIFLTLGTSLMMQPSFLYVFPTLFTHLFTSSVVSNSIVAILHSAFAFASLGGSYGILFSNHWNLYALAQHNHTFLPRLFKYLNEYAIPTYCVLLEGMFCIFYLLLTHGSIVILQQLSVLGCTIAYTLSMLGLIAASRNKELNVNRLLAWLALASCLFFIGVCIRNFYLNGITALIVFAALLIFGLLMFFITKKNNYNELYSN